MSITQQEKREIKSAILESVKNSKNDDSVTLARQIIKAFEFIEEYDDPKAGECTDSSRSSGRECDISYKN